jgi:serralysin
MPKPVWTLDQIADQLTRNRIAWDASEPIAYSFYTKPWAHLGDAPNFSPFSAAQRRALADIFDLVSDIVPLTFSQVPDNGQQPGSGNERIGFFNLNSSNLPFWGAAPSWSTQPSGDQLGLISGANVVVNLAHANGLRAGWDPGGFNVRGLMHELLHALGLPHTGDYDPNGSYEADALYRQDSNQYSVMSYWQAAKTGADHVAGGYIYFAATPMIHDIAALQKLYGANMEARTGDTVYGFNSTADRPAYDIAQNPLPIFSIWDAGGVDTLDLSGFAAAARIDLREGAFSDAGGFTRNISIAYDVIIENAIGGGGADSITGNGAANLLEGGLGNDVLKGGGGIDTASYASAAAAVAVSLAFTAAQDTGAAGSDSLSGIENLSGSAYADTLRGNASANRLEGGAGADRMAGGAGSDTYIVDNGADRAVETSATGGTDLVRSSVSVTLGSYVENLTLTGSGAVDGTGNRGANTLVGNGAANALKGGAGADTLDGGAGRDALEGGAGADGFYMTAALGASNVDAIGDFSAADTLFLSREVFGELTSGTLRAGAFHLGTAAHDATDRIVYDQASGKIFYDADGIGGAAAMLFATVTAGTALTNADFSGY